MHRRSIVISLLAVLAGCSSADREPDNHSNPPPDSGTPTDTPSPPDQTDDFSIDVTSDTGGTKTDKQSADTTCKAGNNCKTDDDDDDDDDTDPDTTVNGQSTGSIVTSD